MTAMTVVTEKYSPDSTYFTTGAVEPDLSGETLTIYTGDGKRRSSWGAPGVTSTLVLQADDLIAIHIGFHHKHGGGQFWRYYQRHEPSWGVVEWMRVDWVHLNDDDRERVLEAYKTKAPSWAKVPGKLKSERNVARSSAPRRAYKMVQVIVHESETLNSVYDPDTEYVLGKSLTQVAVGDHGGGYYTYPSVEAVREAWEARSLFPARYFDIPMRLAIIECEVWGRSVSYSNGKVATTHLRPLRVLETFDHLC